MISRTAHELANEIRMTRSQFPGTFLIVEGRDDRLFMEHFISHANCRIQVANGKQNVCDVIRILDEDHFEGVLGLIDADFDRIDGVPVRSRNLVMPECHDLIVMLVRSPALDRTVREFGSRPKLEKFEDNVREALIDKALPLGYLRLHSVREQLSLRFNGLDYSAWINRSSFLANTVKLVEAVKSHSQRPDLSSTVLARAVEDLNVANYDDYELCNGTDLVEILSIGLRGILGNRNTGEVRGELLKASLRLAFSEQDFCLSDLRRNIEDWQRGRPEFQVLRRDMNCDG